MLMTNSNHFIMMITITKTNSGNNIFNKNDTNNKDENSKSIIIMTIVRVTFTTKNSKYIYKKSFKITHPKVK